MGRTAAAFHPSGPRLPVESAPAETERDLFHHGSPFDRMKAVAAGAFSGALAAVLGLGALSVVVLFLWITSPNADSGPGGALHIAANLWLLAHGADLLRLDSASATRVPLGLTPLLLTALPVWLLNRAGAHAVAVPDDGPRHPLWERPRTRSVPSGHRVAVHRARSARTGEGPITAEAAPLTEGMPEPPASPDPEVPRRIGSESGVMHDVGHPAGEPRDAPGRDIPAPAPDDQQPPHPAIGPVATVASLIAGYFIVTIAALLYTSTGILNSRPLGVLFLVPAIALAAAGTGAWSACGGPELTPPAALRPHIERVPAVLRNLLPPGGTLTAVRAAAVGVLVLLGGGALIASASLIWHALVAGESLTTLTSAVSGRFAVLMLAAALMPNAAVWGAAYALSPGFAVGSGTVVSRTVTEYGALPNFPLLAALPVPGTATGVLLWLPLVIPVAAATTTALGVFRTGQERPGARWNVLQTMVVAALASLILAALMAFLTALAAGPLGSHRLADFGPRWWATGFAALSWTAALALPSVLVAHAVAWCGPGRRAERRAAKQAPPMATVPATAGSGLDGDLRPTATASLARTESAPAPRPHRTPGPDRDPGEVPPPHGFAWPEEPPGEFDGDDDGTTRT